MIVAGFEFTRTIRYPSLFSALQACVPEESNSQACPITMGPAPMIKILSRSVRLGILVHQRDEPPEQVMTVLRPGAGFGVMLDRKHRLADDAQPFVRIVEQREMRWRGPWRPALRVDDKPVILARDLDFAGQ